MNRPLITRLTQLLVLKLNLSRKSSFDFNFSRIENNTGSDKCNKAKSENATENLASNDDLNFTKEIAFTYSVKFEVSTTLPINLPFQKSDMLW